MNKNKIKEYIGVLLLILGFAIISYEIAKYRTIQDCQSDYRRLVIPIIEDLKGYQENEKKDLVQNFYIIGNAIGGWPIYDPRYALKLHLLFGSIFILAGFLLYFNDSLPYSYQLRSFRLYRRKKS